MVGNFNNFVCQVQIIFKNNGERKISTQSGVPLSLTLVHVLLKAYDYIVGVVNVVVIIDDDGGDDDDDDDVVGVGVGGVDGVYVLYNTLRNPRLSHIYIN